MGQSCRISQIFLSEIWMARCVLDYLTFCISGITFYFVLQDNLLDQLVILLAFLSVEKLRGKHHIEIFSHSGCHLKSIDTCEDFFENF